MGWNDEETQNAKKGMSLSSKVLLVMIACIILIIVLLIMLLMNTKETTFKIYVDSAVNNTTKQETLLATVDNVIYVNIEEFAKLVGYEYHKGEYKASIIEEDKCYVEGALETASFYLNDNKVYKLLISESNSQYEEYTTTNPVININNKMYASTDTISRAFNVLISITNDQIQIYTLDYLISLYDTNVKSWGYTGIADQSLENKKALLQGLLIVKKEGGLYKIIDTNNTKEIVLARYTSIEFSENTEEFFVTDTSNKVGIINLDGTTKIEALFDSISLLDKNSNLYIVEESKKYGVVSGTGTSIIYPEYDKIGLENNNLTDNKYLILNELIPVCKDKKWGAFNKEGKLIFNIEYDELGYSSTSIEINGVKELVQPILAIERANGVVVKKENKYGLLSVTGQTLVKTAVDGIYAIREVEDEDSKYFMLYNGEELNVIERLVKAGLISERVEEDVPEDTIGDVENETTTDEGSISEE